jgi:hypothetical protein
MDLREIGWEGVDWMHLRIGTSSVFYEHCNEHSGSTKDGEFLD